LPFSPEIGVHLVSIRGWMLLFFAELFETRIAAQRIEHGIEPEQRGCKGRSGECAKVRDGK
jgi:hypothetical protein